MNQVQEIKTHKEKIKRLEDWNVRLEEVLDDQHPNRSGFTLTDSTLTLIAAVFTLAASLLTFVASLNTGQQRFSNWLTGFGFFFIFALILYAAVHFKYVKLPRRMQKRLERERVLSRLDDIEAVLVERGYMAEKIKKKAKKKSKKVKMSELMRKAKEALENGSGSEESD